MGELINLRRAKKAAERTVKEKAADANRVMYGTPKNVRKAAKTQKQRMAQKIDAHKLDCEEP